MNRYIHLMMASILMLASFFLETKGELSTFEMDNDKDLTVGISGLRKKKPSESKFKPQPKSKQNTEKKGKEKGKGKKKRGKKKGKKKGKKNEKKQEEKQEKKEGKKKFVVKGEGNIMETKVTNQDQAVVKFQREETNSPTISAVPTKTPTLAPTPFPTKKPTPVPTLAPTNPIPTSTPTKRPTLRPTPIPTSSPTSSVCSISADLEMPDLNTFSDSQIGINWDLLRVSKNGEPNSNDCYMDSEFAYVDDKRVVNWGCEIEGWAYFGKNIDYYPDESTDSKAVIPKAERNQSYTISVENYALYDTYYSTDDTDAFSSKLSIIIDKRLACSKKLRPGAAGFSVEISGCNVIKGC